MAERSERENIERQTLRLSHLNDVRFDVDQHDVRYDWKKCFQPIVEQALRRQWSNRGAQIEDKACLSVTRRRLEAESSSKWQKAISVLILCYRITCNLKMT